MTPSQFQPYMLLTDGLIEEIAKRVFTAIRREVPSYGRIVDPEVIADVRDVVRLNVATYLRVLAEDRAPTAAELTRLEAAARRRLGQAIPLDEVLQSYRVGVRVMWQGVLGGWC